MPRKLLRRFMPSPQQVREHRMLSWMGPVLHHPRLWHVSRSGIALGAAIGLFFGLLIPFGQIPIAAVVAIVLRANLPMAVAATFITNPITTVPIYFVAYRVGLWLLGVGHDVTVDTSLLAVTASDHLSWLQGWMSRLTQMGKPLIVGLLVISSSVATLGYFSINWFWRLHTLHAWRQRRHRVST